MICELCKKRPIEHVHHLFSQTKKNIELYEMLIEHPKNKIMLCSICHLNKAIPKLTELEFCKLLKIKPKSKDLTNKINCGKIKKFWECKNKNE